jgi:hypothetical protein
VAAVDVLPLSSVEGTDNVKVRPICNGRELSWNARRVPPEYNSTALLLRTSAEHTGVLNSITKFLAAFYLLLQRSNRMKSFFTQSKIELWLLATIVCMQTETKREKRKNCSIYRCCQLLRLCIMMTKHEYGALVEWQWQGKIEEICISDFRDTRVIHVVANFS